jgi:RimJ/RimL family protein N-acetyltransferase
VALHTISMPDFAAAFPLLLGRLTRLRAPHPDDAGALAAWLPDPAGYLVECRDFLARGDRIDWIVTRRRDDAAIGTCTLYDIDPRARRAEIGYAIAPAWRGNGYATDAAARAIAWAAHAFRLRRIDAHADPANLASHRVLARLGFVAEPPDRYSLSLGGSM